MNFRIKFNNALSLSHSRINFAEKISTNAMKVFDWKLKRIAINIKSYIISIKFIMKSMNRKCNENHIFQNIAAMKTNDTPQYFVIVLLSICWNCWFGAFISLVYTLYTCQWFFKSFFVFYRMRSVVITWYKQKLYQWIMFISTSIHKSIMYYHYGMHSEQYDKLLSLYCALKIGQSRHQSANKCTVHIFIQIYVCIYRYIVCVA